MNTKYIFETRMQVRDYECDIEGIVNNANYLHYCEHTRHLFLKQCGLSFAEMHEKGVDAVLARMTMQFKTPLRPDDEFVSRLGLTKEGIKYVFHHDIYRATDEKLSFRAQAELVCIVNGRLSGSEDYDKAFAPYINY
ncbi:MAG: acyl-CoA thioesterase [Prevotella sp.]|nr:acyl-CoA thioesterase [Prevotella sp.]